MQAGFLEQLVAEALAVLRIPGSPSRVVVATHSGGYRAAAAAALVGWAPRSNTVKEMWLFDSLCANCSCPAIEICNTVNMYANQSDFESWLQEQLPVLCAPPYPLRFVSIYTGSGGTLQLNQATASAVASWPGVSKACLLDDRSTDTLAPQQCASCSACGVKPLVITRAQVHSRNYVQAKRSHTRPSARVLFSAAASDDAAVAVTPICNSPNRRQRAA